MQDIGFEYKTSIDDWNVYVWHTYEIKVQKMIRNGYDCWEFDFGLTKREYKTTRLVEYKELRDKKETVRRGLLAGQLLADVLEADLVEAI